MIKEIFQEFWDEYIQRTAKDYLSYVVTSSDRPNDPKGSPHKIPGNALDFTLRTNGQYSPIKEYNELFANLIDGWEYRAGIDNTPADGNVHIHIDLGKNGATGMPYFFIENNGRWIKQVFDAAELL